MPSPDDLSQTPLERLLALLTTAHDFATSITSDPLVQRLLAAFARLPEPDRETVLGVIERDATWCRLVEQTADTTGITVRPNPQASLYVHVLEPHATPGDEPLQRDVDVIRFGIEQFAAMIPSLFQPGVHAQWQASARALIADTEPALLRDAARLCREVLELIEEAGPPAGR